VVVGAVECVVGEIKFQLFKVVAIDLSVASELIVSRVDDNFLYSRGILEQGCSEKG
jgi:hypothetical protein